MPPKRLMHPQLERQFSPATEQHITSARRLHLCSGRLIIFALSLWLTGCNNQQAATHSLPAPEVTVSKPEQKEVANWNDFTGRTTAVKLVTVTPRVSGSLSIFPLRKATLSTKAICS